MRRMRFSIGGLMGFVVLVAVGFGALKAANPLWASAFYSLAFVGLIASVLVAIQARGRKRAFSIGFSVAGWAYFLLVFVLPSPISSSFEAPMFLTTSLLEETKALFFPEQNNITATTTFSVALPSAVMAPPIPPVVATGPAPTAPIPVPSPSAPAQVVAPTMPALVAPPIQPASALTVNGNGSVIAASYTLPPGTVFPVGTSLGGTISGASEASFEQVGQSMATLILAYLGGFFSLFLAGRRERNEANPAPAPEISPSSP